MYGQVPVLSARRTMPDLRVFDHAQVITNDFVPDCEISLRL